MKMMDCYIRRIGPRLCATFENEQFYMSEDAESDASMLAAAGITEDQLPADCQLPVSWYETACIVSGEISQGD